MNARKSEPTSSQEESGPRCPWCAERGDTVVMVPSGGDFACPVCGASCGSAG